MGHWDTGHWDTGQDHGRMGGFPLVLLVLQDNRRVCQLEDWVVAAWGDKAGMLVLGH